MVVMSRAEATTAVNKTTGAATTRAYDFYRNPKKYYVNGINGMFERSLQILKLNTGNDYEETEIFNDGSCLRALCILYGAIRLCRAS